MNCHNKYQYATLHYGFSIVPSGGNGTSINNFNLKKQGEKLSLRGIYYHGISGLTRIAGFGGAEVLARILSSIRYTGNADMNDVYLGHLSRIFPEKGESELKKLLMGYWRVHQRALLNLFYSRRFNRENIHRIVSWENRSLLDEAVEEGKGVILAVPHFGDERTLHVILAISGYRMHVISSRYSDAPGFVSRTRLSVSQKWHHVAFPDEPLGWLYEALGRGEVIQISPTAWGGPKGHWVRSFGIPVLTSSTPVRIAQSTGCRILIAYNRILPGQRSHISFQRFDPDNLDHRGTGMLFREYEAIARRFPEQYNWMNLVIRHRETNTIARLGGIPKEESVVERSAIREDWNPGNIQTLQAVSSISGSAR